MNFAAEEPVPVMEDGLKPTVTPLGIPDAESVTAESNPLETVLVMVDVPLLPAATERDAGEAARLNEGFCVPEPLSALIRPLLGLPHPVTRS